MMYSLETFKQQAGQFGSSVTTSTSLEGKRQENNVKMVDG